MSKLPWVDSPADDLAFQKFNNRFKPYHFERIIPLPSSKIGELLDAPDTRVEIDNPSENSPCH
jgi:hypothetical protein